MDIDKTRYDELRTAFNELRIALIVDASDEAFTCMDVVMRFSEYLMEDKNEEKRYALEVELLKAKEWIEIAIKNVAFLKKELKNND